MLDSILHHEVHLKSRRCDSLGAVLLCPQITVYRGEHFLEFIELAIRQERMSSLEKGGEPLAVEGLTYLLIAESLAIEVLFAKPTTMLRMGLLASLKPICH